MTFLIISEQPALFSFYTGSCKLCSWSWACGSCFWEERQRGGTTFYGLCNAEIARVEMSVLKYFNTSRGLSLVVLSCSSPGFFVHKERTLEPPAPSFPPLHLRSPLGGQGLQEDCITIIVKIWLPPLLPPLPSESPGTWQSAQPLSLEYSSTLVVKN